MKYFSTFILTFSCLLGSNLLYAQGKTGYDKGFYDKITSHKLEYITEKLALDEKKESLFQNKYLEYRDKRRNLKVDLAKNQLNLEKTDLSDKDVQSIIEKSFALKQESLDLEKEYYAQFKSILTEKEIHIMYRSEEEYNKLMMERFKRDRN